MQDDYRTHRAPYYGGQRFARTLEEAFGPGATWKVQRRAKLRRALPWIVIAVSVVAILVSVVVPK